ncbi:MULTISPECIES: metallophosphoesterase family protein [unclassified Imperialibacter]|uniref:purple acid phosphatase family protein n=1 Tax=unclassified Imperialibacter TaxID=2629706 RepID=UPI001258F32B|nr:MULTISPECIES: metallophosphoesterase family protein [unclassified Imperialibacter]CAD5257769.1 Metallophosphoesterase [Imperialibacter sp. 75]CAD5260733.1 Metallophosphoesterase [Imperialibacter sp. 89]VVT25374.1 Metallophosphoesterase [Imperialibacter sp. EC-SDR9]
MILSKLIRFGPLGIMMLVAVVVLFSCQQNSAEDHHAHEHSHQHSPADSLPNAKLLFPGNEPDRVILNLSEDPIHSVAVNWRTSPKITQGTVEVAVASDGPEFKDSVRTIAAATEPLTVAREEEPEISANYHSAVINELLPGGKYVYRVGSEPYWSEWYQIEMPQENGPVSFVYFGDAQNDVKSMWSRVIREAYHTLPDVDFMLHAGDLINRHDRDVEWGEWFYAGSFIHAMVPAVMTPGNHEYKDVVLSPQWRPQFNLPKNGPAGLEETCYVIDFPQMKLVSLDAEQIDESEHFRALQAQWLDSVLTNNPKKWTVITFHYPVFSTKPNRDNLTLREIFKPLFDKHRVDLVLQGHDHAYGRGMVSNVSTGAGVREDRSGTMYVVSVSGPKMYDISDDKWMERKAANTQLFQVIKVGGDTASYNAFTAKGELYDAFDLVKKAGKPNVLINKIPNTPERTE